MSEYLPDLSPRDFQAPQLVAPKRRPIQDIEKSQSLQEDLSAWEVARLEFQHPAFRLSFFIYVKLIESLQPLEPSVEGFMPEAQVTVLRHPQVKLWRQLLDVSKEHLSRIELLDLEGRVALHVCGQRAGGARGRLLTTLRPMREAHALQEPRRYPTHVARRLAERLRAQGPAYFTGTQKDIDKEIDIDIEESSGTVLVRALRLKHVMKPSEVHGNVFLLRETGYHSTLTCEACMDPFRQEEGQDISTLLRSWWMCAPS